MSQQPVQNVSPEAVEFLYKAIDDTQNTIRFTDTKAGVAIVTGGIVAGYYLQLLNPVLDHFKKPELWVWGVVAAIGLFSLIAIVITVLASLNAIRPISNAHKHINPDGITTNIPFVVSEASKLGFFDLFRERRKLMLSVSAKTLLDRASESEANSEISKSLALELLKLSYIRDKKTYRTSHSITWLVISIFAVIALSIIQRALGWI